MNGTTLATLGQTFNTQVTAMNVTGGTASGTPSTIMLGIIITAPTLTVTATAGTAQNVYANDLGTGGNGLNIGTFTISNGAVGPANLASITLKASGGGDDSTAFSEVGLFEDTNANSTYDPGTDRRHDTFHSLPGQLSLDHFHGRQGDCRFHQRALLRDREIERFHAEFCWATRSIRRSRASRPAAALPRPARLPRS